MGSLINDGVLYDKHMKAYINTVGTLQRVPFSSDFFKHGNDLDIRDYTIPINLKSYSCVLW